MDMLPSVENNGDGTIKLTLDYGMISNIVRFVNNNVRDALTGSIELTFSSWEDLECDWSGCTATVEAVPLDLSVLAEGDACCLAIGCQSAGTESSPIQRPITSNENPVGRLWTLAYIGSKIQSVKDPGGTHIADRRRQRQSHAVDLAPRKRNVLA